MATNTKKVSLEDNHIIVTTRTGEDLKVHPVPMHVLSGIVPSMPKPKRPLVEMKTKTGPQKRFAKKGDTEWDEFQEEMEIWEQAKSDLENDVTLVMALEDYPIPKDFQYPEKIEALIEADLLPEPDNDFSEKAMWLRSNNIVGQYDEHMINLAIQRLAGVPDEVVDQMEAKFRDILLGETAGVVEDADAETADSGEQGLDTNGSIL